MLKGGRSSFVILFTLFFGTDALKEYDTDISKSALPALLGDGSKHRIIILVSNNDTRTPEDRVSLPQGGIDRSDDDEHISSDYGSIAHKSANDDAAYLLYHLLRTKPENADDVVLQATRDILRQGLRSRCQKVDKCVKKCPPKKQTCPQNCQQVFDNLELCPPNKEKKPCKKPKCGKTMPPAWRLRFK